MLRLNGDREAEALVAAPTAESNAAISPDGRWLAMQSNESGRAEIWLRPFPDVNSGRHQVSTSGGTRPVWARSGRELFYMVDPAQGRPDNVITMMAVPMQTSPSLVMGAPVKLFEGRFFSSLTGRTYDVSPDGQRFLMIKDAASTSELSPQIVIVENWFEELKRRVPVK